MRRVFLFAVLLVATAHWAVAAPLRVAVEADFPPFSYEDKNGNLTGFDVEIANALCRELQETCIISAITFDNIIPGLAKGELDIGVAGMSPTEDRQLLVDFTDRYYRSYSVVVGRPEFARIEDMKGRRLGVQRGTTQQEYFRKNYGDVLEIVLYDDFKDLRKDLIAGTIDAMVTAGLPSYAFLKSSAGSAFEIIGHPIRDGYMDGIAAIAVNKRRPDLRRRLNTAIETIRMNGVYQQINRKYFNFSIY